MTMQPSADLIHFLDNEEALRLVAYHLGKEKFWTIGYGHNGPDVHPGMTCTKDQAITWRNQNLNSAAATVNNLVKVPVTQGQFDALVDFVYNVGGGAFHTSHLLLFLNQGHYDAVPAQLKRFIHGSGGEVDGGLVTRRNQEITLFWNKKTA